MTLHISKIRISNILGIDQLEFEPGKFTEISGGNGQGKTSVLEAIKAALQGGHDATLLRKGTSKGEVVLVLDDGTEITKRVTESGSDTKVKQDGKAITRAAERIRGLADLLSVNPVEFLTATKKERVNVLLQAMPIDADITYMAEITGLELDNSLNGLGLAAIDAVRKLVFDARTGTNRAVSEKKATIGQLKQAVPQIADGITGSEDELQSQVDAIDSARHAELDRIAAKLTAIREDTAAAIQKLKDDLAEAERKAAAQREKKLAEFAAQRDPVALQLQVIRQNREAAGARKQTLETIANLQADLESLESEATNQTQSLDELDTYKTDLLSRLPIPGIEVRDGEIYRDGVQFDRLNTAQQVAIAVDVAKLRSGELGTICVDGLELLDDAHYQAFKEAAISSGLQLFVTRVGDGEFSISNS
jgi:predicted ATP-binding protein involved in virulence